MPGGSNQTHDSEEQIHSTSAAAAAALSRSYSEVSGRLRKAEKLNGASRHMKKPIKQIKIIKRVADEHLRHAEIAVSDRKFKKMRFAISWDPPFGMAGAVLHFNSRAFLPGDLFTAGGLRFRPNTSRRLQVS